MINTVIARSVVIVISSLQFVGLLMQWPKIKWLSLYVPVLEACIYFTGIIIPGNGVVELKNGNELSLMKSCGWLVTVPVLLLQLCRLPVKCENRNDKMSALLVVNQLMLTFGFGAEALGNSIAGVILFFIACIFGLKLYFMVFCIYKTSLTEIGQSEKYKKQRLCLQALFFIFYLSWTLFPLAQFLRNIMKMISSESDLVIHVIADLLSKNLYGVILYYYVWKLKPVIENKIKTAGNTDELKMQDNSISINIPNCSTSNYNKQEEEKESNKIFKNVATTPTNPITLWDKSLSSPSHKKIYPNMFDYPSNNKRSNISMLGKSEDILSQYNDFSDNHTIV